jgi:hypothetical protein
VSEVVLALSVAVEKSFLPVYLHVELLVAK